MTAAWLLAPVTVLGFVWLHMRADALSFALAQILFLAPIGLAAVFAELAYAIGPRGIERRAWGLLSLTLLVLLFSEGYYSWYQLFVSRSGPGSPSAFDALNIVAAFMIAAGIAQLAGVGLLRVSDGVRLLFDGLAFSAVAFAGLYHFVVRPLDSSGPWQESVRWSAYSLVGVLIVIGAVWVVVNAKLGPEMHIAALVALGLSIFAGGVLLWPLWRASASADPRTAAGSLAAGVYLLGSYLTMLGGLTRLSARGSGWRIANSRLVSTEGVWASTLISLFVLFGVGLMGVWIYRAPSVAGDARVYLGAAVIATLALVARTGVTALQTMLARNEADIDPVTGAPGGPAFARRLVEVLNSAQRRGNDVSLIVLDVDGFTLVNSALGHAGGDSVLAEVAAVTAQVAAGRGEVFRLGADEFALVAPLAESAAATLATEVLGAIRGLTPAAGSALSASVGVAGCDAGSCTRDELMRRASAAQAWAKYHGKGRVVRFDARIVRALGVEERLRAHDDRSGIDLARALISAADARDSRNYYHSRNVAALSVMLAEALGLSADHVRRIELAAMLHDIGKLGLPDSLLAEVLRTARQQVALREHAVIGETLSQSVGVVGLPSWVRHHHERWDGAGYPDALSRDRIPVESRIIALADAFDAMTSAARTRSPMSRGAALQEIDLGMGSRFDPALAERFIEVIGETASLGWSDEWESA